MAATNVVETIVKLRGSREFQAAAKQTAKSVLGIGDATETSGASTASSRQPSSGGSGIAGSSSRPALGSFHTP